MNYLIQLLVCSGVVLSDFSWQIIWIIHPFESFFSFQRPRLFFISNKSLTNFYPKISFVLRGLTILCTYYSTRIQAKPFWFSVLFLLLIFYCIIFQNSFYIETRCNTSFSHFSHSAVCFLNSHLRKLMQVWNELQNIFNFKLCRVITLT